MAANRSGTGGRPRRLARDLGPAAAVERGGPLEGFRSVHLNAEQALTIEVVHRNRVRTLRAGRTRPLADLERDPRRASRPRRVRRCSTQRRSPHMKCMRCRRLYRSAGRESACDGRLRHGRPAASRVRWRGTRRRCRRVQGTTELLGQPIRGVYRSFLPRCVLPPSCDSYLASSS
jgi:hypothetical protein